MKFGFPILLLSVLSISALAQEKATPPPDKRISVQVRRAGRLVEQNPDILLVILDLAMPRMDGREWLRWFRGCRKESPVIIISAYKLDKADEELKPAVILEKPFDVGELLDMVGLFCGLGTPMAAEAT